MNTWLFEALAAFPQYTAASKWQLIPEFEAFPEIGSMAAPGLNRHFHGEGAQPAAKLQNSLSSICWPGWYSAQVREIRRAEKLFALQKP